MKTGLDWTSMNEPLSELLTELGISLMWLTGYFTAARTGPGSPKPLGWLNDEKQALLRRRSGSRRQLLDCYDEIGEQMKANIAVVCPAPDDTQGIVDFCRGYLEAVRSDKAWPFEESGDPHDPPQAVLFVFQALAHEISRPDLPDHLRGELMEVWRDRERPRLSVHVSYLYEYWADVRRARRESP
ncbi:hypothetical protein LZC95_08290 [Pendulispora brunnea]|uniref:Uncharacterized protein n=1 Tax=Pendulispora brunnea TaxID=2905690 RepID=A0ABZ2KIR0_9BACT